MVEEISSKCFEPDAFKSEHTKAVIRDDLTCCIGEPVTLFSAINNLKMS